MYVSQIIMLKIAKIRNDVDFNELASLIMAVMDGLQIQWLLDPKKADMVATFKLFLKIIVRYLVG